jgi:hypothetical protein
MIHLPHERINRFPLALAALLGAGGAFAANKIMSGKQQQAQTIPTPTANASQQVQNDVNKTSQAQNAGRAALIMTSPQGVQGTNPVGRYKLLGND